VQTVLLNAAVQNHRYFRPALFLRAPHAHAPPPREHNAPGLNLASQVAAAAASWAAAGAPLPVPSPPDEAPVSFEIAVARLIDDLQRGAGAGPGASGGSVGSVGGASTWTTTTATTQQQEQQEEQEEQAPARMCGTEPVAVRAATFSADAVESWAATLGKLEAAHNPAPHNAPAAPSAACASSAAAASNTPRDVSAPPHGQQDDSGGAAP
jgi:hypothetical protein